MRGAGAWGTRAAGPSRRRDCTARSRQTQLRRRGEGGCRRTRDGGQDVGEQDDAVGLERAPRLQGHLDRDVHILCGAQGRRGAAGQQRVAPGRTGSPAAVLACRGQRARAGCRELQPAGRMLVLASLLGLRVCRLQRHEAHPRCEMRWGACRQAALPARTPAATPAPAASQPDGDPPGAPDRSRKVVCFLQSSWYTFMYRPAWRIIHTGGRSTASPRSARSMSGSSLLPCRSASGCRAQGTRHTPRWEAVPEGVAREASTDQRQREASTLLQRGSSRRRVQAPPPAARSPAW